MDKQQRFPSFCAQFYANLRKKTFVKINIFAQKSTFLLISRKFHEMFRENTKTNTNNLGWWSVSVPDAAGEVDGAGQLHEQLRHPQQLRLRLCNIGWIF
jgi:hypothetical protein